MVEVAAQLARDAAAKIADVATLALVERFCADSVSDEPTAGQPVAGRAVAVVPHISCASTV